MKTFFTIASLVTAVAFAEEDPHAQARRVLASAGAAWTYRTTGKNGSEPLQPEDWGVAYPDCYGDRQSPINLSAAYMTPAKYGDLGLTYMPKECSSASHGYLPSDHTWKVDFGSCSTKPETTSRVMWKGEAYDLLQFHIHSPSEHTIGGGEYDAEIHLVHVKADGSGTLLVLGIMIDAAEAYSDNLKLKPYWDQMMGIGSPFSGMPYDILPADPSYYHYRGSLTTPPCSEVVMWIVLASPVLMSDVQLKVFRSFVQAHPVSTVDEAGNTHRPTQPVNGRPVYALMGA